MSLSCNTTTGPMWRRLRWCGGVAACVAAPWPSAWEVCGAARTHLL